MDADLIPSSPGDRPGGNVNSAVFLRGPAKPLFAAQQASDAHDQHVSPACQRLWHKFGQRCLACGFDGQIAAVDHFIDRDDRRMAKKFRGESLRSRAVLICQRDQLRIQLMLVERLRNHAPDRTHAENSDL